MARAIWNGEVIAEADDNEVEMVENDLYFPIEKVKDEYLQESIHQTVCPWMGTATYCHLVVDGKVNENAAWFYRHPSEAASLVRDHIAFRQDVEVQR